MRLIDWLDHPRQRQHWGRWPILRVALAWGIWKLKWSRYR